MEIKKFNPDGSSQLSGDVEERKTVNNSNTENLTMEDEVENDEEESTAGAEAEGGDPVSNSLTGEDELDEDGEDDASDQLTGDDGLDEDEGDDESDQLTGEDEQSEDVDEDSFDKN